MKKKLSLLVFALAALTAFAVQVSRRAATALIDYPTSDAGITLVSIDANGNPVEQVVYTTVSIKGESKDCIKFGKSYKMGEVEKYYAELRVEGGFKAGDVISITGAYSNAEEKNAAIAFYDANKTKVWTTENFVNVKDGTTEPTAQTFTLTADTDVLYMGRSGNTGTSIVELTISREATPEKEAAVPDGTYYVMNANVGAVVNAEGGIDAKGTPITFTYDATTGSYTLAGTDFFAGKQWTVANLYEDMPGYFNITTVVDGATKYLTADAESKLVLADAADDNAVWIVLQKAYYEDIMNSTYTVAGTKNLTGTENDWEITEANQMKYNEETGLFQITYNNITVSDDVKPEFKVVKKPIEGEAIWYPEGENNNLVITPEALGGAGEYEISITFDPSDSKEIKFSGLKIEDVTIKPEAGEDIFAALVAAKMNIKTRNITIDLAENANYTISAPIVAPADITINGNGATIDASGLDGNFIQMAVVESPTEWTKADVTIKGITVKGLKKALFYSACKNYYGDVTVDNCVVELAGDATTFDYTKGSTAVNFTITNSTFYAPTATTKSFYSSQGGQKTTEYQEEAVQTFKFANNTLYNLAPGKNFFTHRQANQKWMAYDVENNIFVNCGKNGQVIKGMNGGQSGANPTWTIKGNIFNFEADGVMTDTSAAEDTGDTTEGEGVQNSVAGVVTFTDAAAGDFNGAFALAEGASVPAKMPGDPRWKVSIPTEDIEISPAEGDISAALATASEGKNVGNISIYLTEGATYNVSAPIVAPASITIYGNGATIDASGLEGNFIQMAVVESPTDWTEANVIIQHVTVKGLKKALFYSACKNYYGGLLVDNCVVELAGDATTFDYTKGSTAVDFVIANSTFYAPTATTKSFYSSQAGQKTTEYQEEAVQTFRFVNNTLYNLAPGKNFFTHRQANQKWMAYDVENNIFVNCGKSGQVIKGMNGGQSGANPTWTIKGNVFNFAADGVMTDTSAAEDTGDTTEGEGVQNSIAGVISFTDAAAGDFNGTLTMSEGATAPESEFGDTRWTINVSIPTGISTVNTAAKNGEGEWYTVNGVRVSQPTKKGLYIHNGKKVVVK